MIYVYEELLFFDEDEVNEFIAREVNYLGEEGLMNKIENEVFLIESMNELLDFCKEIDTTYEELCDEYRVILEDRL